MLTYIYFEVIFSLNTHGRGSSPPSTTGTFRTSPSTSTCTIHVPATDQPLPRRIVAR
jgi:hypothetical protein